MKSMTGYGAAEGKVGKGIIFIEVKAVNHRYCDVQLKIPPRMNSLDPALRKVVKENCERGKIELYLKEKKGIIPVRGLSLDMDLAKKYHECLEKLQKELGPVKKEVHLLEVIDARELIAVEDIDINYWKYWDMIRKIAVNALRKMDKMRSREGAYLLKDHKVRLNKISSLVKNISKQSAKHLENYQAKIRARLKGDSNNNVRERIDSEVAMIAEKVDVAEELTRLSSHLNQYRMLLKLREPVGRQIDFLLQEMNREINTIGAKANNAKISTHVIEIKSELEKLREQAQNIE